MYALYTQAQTSINTAANTAEKTIKERVALLRTELGKQEKAINEAYAELVSDAKENAISGLESLYKSGHNTDNDDLSLGGRKDMTDADRAAMLSKGKNEVNACTTLNAIGKLVSNNLNNTNYIGDSTSSYAILERNRAAVFEAIDDALEDVYEIDNEFNPDDPNNKTLVSTLKDTYGIQNSELPTTVADNYRKKASSATSFSTVSKTDSTLVLAKEASEAIQNAYDSIMEKVETAIINSYDVDIKAYSTDQDWITSTHAVVVNLVQNWVKTARDGTTGIASYSDEKLSDIYFGKLSVSNLVSYSGEGTNASPYGGVAYIEAYLAKWNIPFTTYRLNKERNAITSTVSAYAANIVNNDAKYNSFLTTSKDNPIKDTTGTLNNGAEYFSVAQVHQCNVLKVVEEIKVPDSITTIAEVRAVLQDYKDFIDQTYARAKVMYINAYDELNDTDGDYALYSTIANEITAAKGYSVDSNSTLGDDVKLFTDEYKSKVADVTANVSSDDIDEIKAENFSEIDDYVTNFKNHLTLIKSLNKGYNDFIGTINDMNFSDSVYQSDINDEKASIFKNTVSASDVQTFINNLKTSYANKIALYLADAKDRLEKIYNDEYVKGGNADFNMQYIRELKKIYDSLVKQAGTTFACNSYHSIDSWLKFAERKLAEFADDDLSAVPTELAGDSADGTVVEKVTGDTISEGLTISTVKGLGVDDASVYDSVYDIKVSSLDGYSSGDVYDDYEESDRVNGKIYAVNFKIGESTLSEEKAYLSIDGEIKYSGSKGKNNLSDVDGTLSVLFKEAGKKSIVVEWSKGGADDPVHRVKINIEVGSLSTRVMA